MANKELLETSCIKEAAKQLGFAVRVFDASGNFFSIDVDGRNLFFANRSGPWNSDSVFKIWRDKEFSYFLLKDAIRMPKSAGFADPFYVPPGAPAKKISERETTAAFRALAESLAQIFKFPFVLKMNSGLKGINVFLVKDKAEAIKALGEIFNPNSRTYDYIALAQEYVKISEEYRAIVFRKELVAVYKKGGKATPAGDEKTKKEIFDFIKPAFGIIDFDFSAFDIVRDKGGSLFLLEGNSRPAFSRFAKDNGRQALVDMYKKILTILREK